MKNGNRQKVKKMRKLIIAYLTSLFLISCATVRDPYKNPVEEAAVNKDQYAKVIFYNDTNLILYPSSSAIGIEIIIDGTRAARLKRGQYIDLSNSRRSIKPRNCHEIALAFS